MVAPGHCKKRRVRQTESATFAQEFPINCLPPMCVVFLWHTSSLLMTLLYRLYGSAVLSLDVRFSSNPAYPRRTQTKTVSLAYPIEVFGSKLSYTLSDAKLRSFGSSTKPIPLPYLFDPTVSTTALDRFSACPLPAFFYLTKTNAQGLYLSLLMFFGRSSLLCQPAHWPIGQFRHWILLSCC